MTNYLAFIICLNIAPRYMEACKVSVKAASIQSGFQIYSDGLDRYSEIQAKRMVSKLSIPETIIGAGYIAYNFGVKDSLLLPIGNNWLSDRGTIWGSRHSLGVSLEWDW